jgi:undecaprenol kinase
MLRLNRLVKSFGYSFRGLFKMFREEQNLQVQSLIAIIVLVLAAYVGIKPVEWCLIVISIALVVLMETVNSAIERVADTLKPRIHIYIKEVKDIMAAAVMISSLSAIAVGLFVFIPYFLR